MIRQFQQNSAPLNDFTLNLNQLGVTVTLFQCLCGRVINMSARWHLLNQCRDVVIRDVNNDIAVPRGRKCFGILCFSTRYAVVFNRESSGLTLCCRWARNRLPASAAISRGLQSGPLLRLLLANFHVYHPWLPARLFNKILFFAELLSVVPVPGVAQSALQLMFTRHKTTWLMQDENFTLPIEDFTCCWRRASNGKMGFSV